MIGKKILELRKQNHLSQEELAEKLDVTRQTISNWELGETIPDLKQASELSKIFNISIDTLVGNKNVDELHQKVNNTETTSKKILKIVKKIAIIVGILLLFTMIIIIFIFSSLEYFEASPSSSGIGTTCKYKDEYIYYEVIKDYQSGNLSLNTTDTEILNKFKPYDYTNAEKMLNDITEYIEKNGGKCGINSNE